MNTGVQALLQITLVELAHAADAKLVVLADEFERPVRGRIKRDVFDPQSKTVVRDVEIDERASHEDSGGVNLLVESVLAIDEENVEVLSREQASTLEPGKSCADDGHVVARSHRFGILRARLDCGQVLYGAKKARFRFAACGINGLR